MSAPLRMVESHLPSMIGTMHHDRVDFCDPIDRNPIVLLQRQRMIRRLKLDPWSNSVVAKIMASNEVGTATMRPLRAICFNWERGIMWARTIRPPHGE
jgi:hypothetical protein